MKGKLSVFILLFSLFLASCNNDRLEGAAAAGTASDAKVRASEYATDAPEGEWTFGQIETQVFAGTGLPLQWDGQPLNEARSFIHLTVAGQCGEGYCGKEVFLVNTNQERGVRVVVTIPFQVEGSAGYIAREYNIGPGEKLPGGCSHLCEGERSTEFRRAIVEAEFISPTAQ